MDYYKMRANILHRLKQHLAARKEAINKKHTPPEFSVFQDNIISEYGVTENFIKKMVEYATKGGTVENGEIKRRDE